MANRYDVNIQIVPAAAYGGMAFYSFGQLRSVGVRGINKLVNEFAKFLLTPIGTDSIDLSYGTLLPGLIGSNVALSDAQEILQVAVTATVDAINRFQAAQPETPDDERLASAEITRLIVVDEAPGFAAQILVRNVANQGLSLILPTLSVTPK